MKCAACARDCRMTRLAHVAAEDGGLRRARVCVTCFSSALHIVPRLVTVKKGADETKARKREAADAVRGAVKKLRATATAYRRTSLSSGGGVRQEERADGLDQAADLLEAGDY